MTWDYFNTRWNSRCIETWFQKIINSLDTTSDKNLLQFVTKKWIEVYDQSGKKLQCQQRN